jgi:hypothetical protein
MIFQFIVRRFRFFATIPLAAQFFDAFLLTWTALFHRELLKAMELLHQQISQFESIRLCSHRFSGVGFKINTHEFAHLHSNGLLDIELSRDRAAQLVAQKRALPHHVFGLSRWISFWLSTPADIPDALELIQLGSKAARDASFKAPLSEHLHEVAVESAAS